MAKATPTFISRKQNLYQDIYTRVHRELFEEQVNRFVLFHSRLPTPEEEGSIFESIDEGVVKQKFKTLASDYFLDDYTDVEEEYKNLVGQV